MADDITHAMGAFRAHVRPREGVGDNPFRLACTFGAPVDDAEIASAWAGAEVPDELARVWSISGSSRLFEDVDFGQWGLRLLSPREAAQRTRQERTQRPDVYRGDDIVIGEFLGDLELVVVAPSEAGRRRVLIALPLDDRLDWYAAAENFAEFLERYLKAFGDRYWEAGK